jgi:hypothetical protein
MSSHPSLSGSSAPLSPSRRLAKAAGVAIVGLALVGVTGCSNLNSTQERSLSGGAIGAGAGAVAGAATGGCISCGAVIGGAIGAGAGYIYDQAEKNK